MDRSYWYPWFWIPALTPTKTHALAHDASITPKRYRIWPLVHLQAWPVPVNSAEAPTGGALGRRHLVRSDTPGPESATSAKTQRSFSRALRTTQEQSLPKTSLRSLTQVGDPSLSKNSSLPERLDDMLCGTAWWVPGAQDPKCPKPNFAVEEGSGFKPVKIPVVFHCEWGAKGNGSWRGAGAG